MAEITTTVTVHPSDELPDEAMLVEWPGFRRGRIDLQRDSATRIARISGLSPAEALSLIDYRSPGVPFSLDEVVATGTLTPAAVDRLTELALGPEDRTQSTLTEVKAPRTLHAGQPFDLRYTFTKTRTRAGRPAVLQVRYTMPSGRRFTRYHPVTAEDARRGYLDVEGVSCGAFGPMRIEGTLFTVGGGDSAVDLVAVVLPSNPIQLWVTARNEFPTAWRGPAKRQANGSYRCDASFWILNGTNQTQTFNLLRMKTWEGLLETGTKLDEWTAAIGTITVAANGISGRIGVSHSFPAGTATADSFDIDNDLDLQHIVLANSGDEAKGTSVWSTMNAVGLNLIFIGNWSGTEQDEAHRAAEDIASSIYEQWNLHIDRVHRWYLWGDDVNTYRDIDVDSSEADGLAKGWAVDENDSVDVFLSETFSGSSNPFGFSYVDGTDDTTKNSADSAFHVRKDPDALNLAQTFAHELGHYLGLEHADDDDGLTDTDPASPDISDNFIFSASARDSAIVTFQQWRKMSDHGFVRRAGITPGHRLVSGWWGWQNQGAAAAIGSIQDRTTTDLAVLHVDNPTYNNRAYYRIGFDVDASGNPDLWGDPIAVPGWFGWENQAGGIAVADISAGTTPDLVVFHIDNPTGRQNTGWYRIGWDLDATGQASSWSPVKSVPGTLGDLNHGGGIAIGDIGGTGRPDLVVFWIEDRAGENVGRYRIGWDLDAAGDPSSWSAVKAIPGWWGATNAGGDVALADLDGNGMFDLVVFHIDNPSGENRGHLRIGRSLNTAGNAASWSVPRTVPGWFGSENQGAGLALGDLGSGGGHDVVVFHIDNPSGENQGWYRVGWDLDIDGNVRLWR